MVDEKRLSPLKRITDSQDTNVIDKSIKNKQMADRRYDNLDPISLSFAIDLVNQLLNNFLPGKDPITITFLFLIEFTTLLISYITSEYPYAVMINMRARDIGHNSRRRFHYPAS